MGLNWSLRKNPVRLECRVEFSDYDETRDFLDRAAELAEKQGYYPDMSFGRTHVSITLSPQDDSGIISDELKGYADLMDELVSTEQTVDETK
ncbi:MAG: 4a-hydroxytetrahydrobiopterin dehydratase [Gammaproteobacteria bacterium]|nr:4a-hydroxytetrahydrobiopterin dehydratase [Gammaproteobacteria bacterium]MCF6230432.1 4a-hydroxytetrahydrobiopterin dehydratase [Gammaproteobacteria bacterium]